MQKNNAARQLLLAGNHGILATISLDVKGYPFGSVTPYCVDDQCRPIIYISYIAQHTRNILADPRVSLTVVENTDSDDVQASGRVTCIGNAREVTDGVSEVRDRYFRYFPSAKGYEQTHGFAFFRLDLVRIRFIGGFGHIYWVEPEEFMAPNPFSAAEETGILAHMNADHQKVLGPSTVMVGIDGEGFDVLRSGRKMRIPFEVPVTNMDEARKALIAIAKKSA